MNRENCFLIQYSVGGFRYIVQYTINTLVKCLQSILHFSHLSVDYELFSHNFFPKRDRRKSTEKTMIISIDSSRSLFLFREGPVQKTAVIADHNSIIGHWTSIHIWQQGKQLAEQHTIGRLVFKRTQQNGKAYKSGPWEKRQDWLDYWNCSARESSNKPIMQIEPRSVWSKYEGNIRVHKVESIHKSRTQSSGTKQKATRICQKNLHRNKSGERSKAMDELHWERKKPARESYSSVP
jgi:hypothetical protein